MLKVQFHDEKNSNRSSQQAAFWEAEIWEDDVSPLINGFWIRYCQGCGTYAPALHWGMQGWAQYHHQGFKGKIFPATVLKVMEASKKPRTDKSGINGRNNTKIF